MISLLPLLLLLTSLSARADLPELKIASDPWCPITCERENTPNQQEGIFIDVLREAFAGKFKVSYEPLNWARALQETRKGQYNAIAGALVKDAPDFVFPSTPIYEQKSCFYVSTSSGWAYKNNASLKAKKLGVVRDYTYGEPIDSYINKNIKDNNIIDITSGTKTTENLINKLNASRVDVIVEDKTVMEYFLKQNSNITIKNAGCISPLPLFVAFSPSIPQSKELAKQLSEAVKKMKSNGKITEIVNRYR